MTFRDEWPFIFIAVIFGAIVVGMFVSAYVIGKQRSAFAQACHAVGGTPLHIDSDSFCVAQFADMRGKQ